MKGLEVKANWGDASARIMYRVGRNDSWHYSVFQVADADHSKTKAKSLVKRWLMNEGYSQNPSRRSTEKRVSRALTKYVRNFTGTITRTADGQVVIAGTGPKPKTAKNPRLQLEVKANWAQASAPIMYREGRNDSWHHSVFQVADARHSKVKARQIVKHWLEAGNR